MRNLHGCLHLGDAREPRVAGDRPVSDGGSHERARSSTDDRGSPVRPDGPPIVRAALGCVRHHRADRNPAARQFRRSDGADRQPDRQRVPRHQARRRRRAQSAVVAGRHPAQPAFRLWHQGPGRQPHLLRAAGGLGRRRQPEANPRRDDPVAREWRLGRRRQIGDLEAETRREMA